MQVVAHVRLVAEDPDRVAGDELRDRRADESLQALGREGNAVGVADAQGRRREPAVLGAHAQELLDRELLDAVRGAGPARVILAKGPIARPRGRRRRPRCSRTRSGGTPALARTASSSVSVGQEVRRRVARQVGVRGQRRVRPGEVHDRIDAVDERGRVAGGCEVALQPGDPGCAACSLVGNVRVSARTSCPRAARCGTSTDPRKPDAPVTAILMSDPFRPAGAPPPGAGAGSAPSPADATASACSRACGR